MCKKISTGNTIKKNRDRVILSSILSMLNCRSQQVNGFQTLMGIFFYSDGMSKGAMEVNHELGNCCSYAHLTRVLKELAGELKQQSARDARTKPMLISLDNVNQMVGVRDATSTRSGMMVNSTGGFCTPIFGIEPGKRFIPREWMRNAGRVELTPRALEPNLKAFEMIRAHNEWCLVQLLQKHVGVVVGGNEFVKPCVELLDLVPDNIIPFSLMDIEQSSTEGNLRGISRVLLDDLGYTKTDLMKGILIIVGGMGYWF